MLNERRNWRDLPAKTTDMMSLSTSQAKVSFLDEMFSNVEYWEQRIILIKGERGDVWSPSVSIRLSIVQRLSVGISAMLTCLEPGLRFYYTDCFAYSSVYVFVARGDFGAVAYVCYNFLGAASVYS